MGPATEKLPSGAPCGSRARLHQLGEALIPRGTKSSNRLPPAESHTKCAATAKPVRVARWVRASASKWDAELCCKVSGGVGGETPREVAVFGLQRKRPVGSV